MTDPTSLSGFSSPDAAINRLRKRLRREHQPARPPMPKGDGPPPLRARLAALAARIERTAPEGPRQ